MKVMARICFSREEDDTDGAVKALRRVGYVVHRMSCDDIGAAGYDCVEALIDGSDDDKTMDAIMDVVWDEVKGIIDRHGGDLTETLTVDEKHYVPFEYDQPRFHS